MKSFLFFFFSIMAVGCWITNSANADEWRVSNSRYETLHIKQMAHRNFSNHGRSRYVYEKQEYSLYGSDSMSLGAVQLERNSSIREMYIAVDLKRSQRIQRLHQNRKISIGQVSGYAKQLKLRSINVFVNSNETLHY